MISLVNLNSLLMKVYLVKMLKWITQLFYSLHALNLLILSLEIGTAVDKDITDWMLDEDSNSIPMSISPEHFELKVFFKSQFACDVVLRCFLARLQVHGLKYLSVQAPTLEFDAGTWKLSGNQ